MRNHRGTEYKDGAVNATVLCSIPTQGNALYIHPADPAIFVAQCIEKTSISNKLFLHGK